MSYLQAGILNVQLIHLLTIQRDTKNFIKTQRTSKWH